MPIDSQKTINWGGVLKGAAIVTAVAVAAVGGFYALQFGAGFVTQLIAGNGTAAILADTAVGYGSTALGYITAAATWLWNSITSIPATIVEFFGLSGTNAFASAQPAINTAAGVVGASVAAAASIPAATHALQQINFVDTHHHLGAHDAAHTAQHVAAEHSNQPHKKSWTNQYGSKASFASHAEAVRTANPPSPTRNVPTPKDSFAEQLNAETSQLNRML